MIAKPRMARLGITAPRSCRPRRRPHFGVLIGIYEDDPFGQRRHQSSETVITMDDGLRSGPALPSCRRDDFLGESLQLVVTFAPENEGVEAMIEGEFHQLVGPLIDGAVKWAV